MGDCTDGCTYGFHFNWQGDMAPVGEAEPNPLYQFDFCPWCGRKLEERPRDLEGDCDQDHHDPYYQF